MHLFELNFSREKKNEKKAPYNDSKILECKVLLEFKDMTP